MSTKGNQVGGDFFCATAPPSISVVICAYNAEEYICECLDSVAGQFVPPLQLILVDDGSTDGTPAIADAFAAEHAYCQVLHSANEGLLLARRRGLSHCSGEYVMFLDSDDALRPDALEVAMEAARAGDADIVIFRHSRNGGFSSSGLVPKPSAGPYEGAESCRRLVLAGNINSMWGKLYRLSLFDVDADYSRFARLMHGEDLLQLLPVFGSAERVTVIDEVLYYYRPSEDASTSHYRVKQREDIAVVLNEVSARTREWGLRPADSACWARNITFLLSLLYDDESVDSEVQATELDAIRNMAQGYFVHGDGSLGSLRFDYRLLLIFLLRGSYRSLCILVALRKALSQRAVDFAGRRCLKVPWRARRRGDTFVPRDIRPAETSDKIP